MNAHFGEKGLDLIHDVHDALSAAVRIHGVPRWHREFHCGPGEDLMRVPHEWVVAPWNVLLLKSADAELFRNITASMQ